MDAGHGLHAVPVGEREVEQDGVEGVLLEVGEGGGKAGDVGQGEAGAGRRSRGVNGVGIGVLILVLMLAQHLLHQAGVAGVVFHQ